MSDQLENGGPYQDALSAEEIERRIMDSAFPKTSMEWWARGEIEKLRARIAELEARDDAALRAATILAVSLAEKHWPENMDCRPLDETAGVISQINNMCAGLDARIAELEATITAATVILSESGVPSEDKNEDAFNVLTAAISSSARAALKGED